MSDISVKEIRRIRDLCVELLETLTITLQKVLEYANDHDIPLPVNLSPLLGHTINIIHELDFPPPSVQHLFRTPPDKTESSSPPR